jgi:hypothetical protein
MKTYGIAILLGICIIGFPLASFAALDWRIEWDEESSPYTARVYIFNPEEMFQTFTLETGDVAKTDSTNQYAPYLFIGQDVSFAQIAPSERKIFEIIVYKDIDPEQAFSVTTGEKPVRITSEQHQQELRLLGEKYGKSKSRQYPFAIMGITPIERETPSPNRAIYRNKRGYWITTIIDHDHIAEQLIRAGEQLGAEFDSIQQAIFYYTQGNVQLTGEALAVWNAAFPELNAEVSPTPPSVDGCTYFVMVVTSNLTWYTAGHTITIGDILASSDPSLSPVVAAEDVNFNISPNTQSSKRLLRVYLMSKRGQPSENSEYVRIITHDSQIERAIRIGIADQYHACAIQDVIWYFNHEVPSLTIGKGLWDRIGGYVTPIPANGRYSPCLGNPTTQPTGRQADGMTFKNLVVLVGAVVPFSLLFRRRGRKP